MKKAVLLLEGMKAKAGQVFVGLMVALTIVAPSNFLFINSAKAVEVEPSSEGCTLNDPQYYYSGEEGDTTLVDDEDNAVVLGGEPFTLPGAWTNLSGAQWIWSENPPAVGTEEGNDVTHVFSRNFEISGNPLDSELEIAADNYYTVEVNGNEIETGTSGTDLENFDSVSTWTIPAADLNTGSNVLTITVVNPGGYGEYNPGGLLYKLTVNSETCPLPAPECSSSSYFDDFALGNVNSQNGWKSTGSFDQEIVENTYGYDSFGCQSLRISDAVTSGSFGDQTFSAPLDGYEAGEADAENGGESSGPRYNHFEAEFDIASTTPNYQPGMHLAVSPDRGDGARMSYLRFDDQEDGIHVFFYDVQDPEQECPEDAFVETEVGTISRTPHTIKFSMDFLDGAGNDVVNIYIDGTLVHTGTSWEDYYRFCEESNPELNNTSRTVDSLLFRESGASNSEDEGMGFLIDNFSMDVAELPQVRILKDTMDSGDGEFGFNISETDSEEESGQNVYIETTEGWGSEYVTLQPGTYDINEFDQEGWNLYDSYCYVDGLEKFIFDDSESELPTTNLELGYGDYVTCRFYNTTQPILTVKKVVVNDDEGLSTAGQFTFQVDGNELNWFDETEDPLMGVKKLVMESGVYTVTEPHVDGYETEYDNCENIELTEGNEVTCTITNDDIHRRGGSSGSRTDRGQVLGASTDSCTNPDFMSELVAVYRFWNPVTADHAYFTTNSAPAGFTPEGILGYIYKTQVGSSVPLYALYNASNGDHMYTTSATEAAASGYANQGILGYIYPSQVEGSSAIYRLWNSGNADHIYTFSDAEVAAVLQMGYVSEGITGYFCGNSVPGAETMPLYRLFSSRGTDHLYTTNAPERDSALKLGYVSEGITGYLFGVVGTGRDALYRLFNAANVDHMYTTTVSEYNTPAAGYAKEGVVGYLLNSQSGGSSALIGLYNSTTHDHIYTTSTAERDEKLGQGYLLQGTLGYINQ